MKRIALLALALLLTASARAVTPLPDACGKDEVQFKVQTSAPSASLSQPEAGKAQIVFLETIYGAIGVHPTVRFAVDGSWAGAARSSSYLIIAVAPGEHHLCASWQSRFSILNDQPGAMPLKVEARKTYFVDYKITAAGKGAPVIAFNQINDDLARFYLKSYPLASWTTKQ